MLLESCTGLQMVQWGCKRAAQLHPISYSTQDPGILMIHDESKAARC